MVYSSPSNFWIKQGAVTFTLNALNDPDKLAIAISAGAVIMAYAKVNNQVIIDYNASHNYRTWALQASPTHFERTDKVYVYARLSKVGDTAMLVFPYEKIPIDPALDEGSSNFDPNYYYILLGALTPSMVGDVQTLREWDIEEGLSFGTLDTDEQWNEQSSSALDKMFKIDGNNVIWAQNNLTFLAGKRLLLLRMSVLGDSSGANPAEITSITKAANIDSASFAGSESSLPTTAAMARYVYLYTESFKNKFLSKEHDDATPYKLTMREAEVVEDAGVGGDLTVLGDAAVGGKTSTAALEVIGHGINDRAVFHVPLESDNFNTGFAGWQLDRNGNLEVETVHARSAIITDELRINRQQAQEGDTMFTDNDQIELVTPIFAPATTQSGDNPSAKGWYERTEEGGDAVYTLTTDTSVVAGKTYYYIDSYILDLKEKWDGYFTAQQVGNILRGKINTLAAKEAGVSDYTDPEYAPSQQQDAGGNKYYTSFLAVINTHNTAPSLLSTNQIQVSMYGDTMVPMARNYPPCALMTVARWGCYLDPAESGITDDERQSRMRRQSLFMISTSDGHLVKLHGVNKPILEDFNFGTTLGDLPTFIKNNPNIQTIYGQDYLYAQGIIVEDYIKIDVHGVPEKKVVAFKEWVNGAATGTVIIPVWDEQQQEYVDTPFPLPIPQSELSNPASPYIGYGIYLAGEQNMLTRDYEIHDVYYYGMRWRVRQHIPVIDQQGVHFYEPKWNSPYWDIIEGDERLTMRITSSNGFGFRRGYVNTLVTPIVFYGSIDISEDLFPAYWNWYRCEEVNWNGGNPTYTPADEHWNETHRGMRAITITDEDMPSSWGRANKIIFTCVATVNNGRQTLNVPNSIRI